MDEWDTVKTQDPYIFVRAEEFFSGIDCGTNDVKHPSSIKYLKEDQYLDDGTPNEACSHGRIFRFNDDSLLLIQFLRPKVWRLRFDPANTKGSDFTKYNTRAIICNTTDQLIETLDRSEGIKWKIEVIKDPQHIILQTVVDPDTANRRIEVQLWIKRDPFQIKAVRVVQSSPPAEKIPQMQRPDTASANSVQLDTQNGSQAAVIWKTKPRGLMYQGNATVLAVEKSVTADYMGFGEQGGKELFKNHTYMNYFNFDNMRYQNVYGHGPKDNREPLYHSEPFWIEVDSHPGYRSQVATFIDNYSHICVDVGMKDQNAIRVATRFNSFNCMVVAADNMSDLVCQYTSIVGKPRLKPRYVLGHHQGCYGYDTKEMVLEAVDEYRKAGIPLDCMHIDVDMQDDYRTFTIDTREGHFPDPSGMFDTLRKRGVKCSTNITPYINSTPKADYTTLQEGLDNDYFIVDRRDKDPAAPAASQVRYQGWEVGKQTFKAPIHEKPPYYEEDTYDFAQVYDSGKPFHGGVFYGWKNGHPGHYPNLNIKKVREWWGRQYKYLFECGLDFVWQDMTTPCIAEQYGDMKSLPFRLLLDSDGYSGELNQPQKKAIEIWALYSYNLHKATYHGLNHIHELSDKLKWRESRRNFIIGRGSFVGSHRYAGLWTGDNASTWEFLSISIAQVLALGMSGITISGQDVGGFEFKEDEKFFANPELLIRWYCAYSMLPWFRNHYTRKRMWNDGPRKGQMRKDGKLFQEPYAYKKYYEENSGRLHGREGMLYRAVEPICRYYIRLRYSLMQLLYDAMFENMVTGLPIARAMVITDDVDRTLFSKDNKSFTSSQYMVRNDLLVAPALRSEAERNTRLVYLPYPNKWYTMNLLPDEELGKALTMPTDGGSRIKYNCQITDEEEQLPYITPMFIREGAIIPKIEVRDYVPDPSLSPLPANPITLHIYPGRDNTYEMYIDDGISRDSAPSSPIEGQSDPMAADKYTQVSISQTSTIHQVEDHIEYDRIVTIKSPHNGFTDTLKIIGSKYTIVYWHSPTVNIRSVIVTGSIKNIHTTTNYDKRATIVTIPVADAHTAWGVTLRLSHTCLVSGRQQPR